MGQFEKMPVIQSTELIKVKFISTDVGYITLVDVTCEPHIKPEHFLKFFEILKTEARKITPEATSYRELCLEENKYTTSVETFKFPFVAERYTVLTVYKVPNYKSAGNHLYIASDRGN